MKKPKHEPRGQSIDGGDPGRGRLDQVQLSPRQERIREASQRNAKALQLRPSIGQGTGVTKVRLGEGLRCEIAEGNWQLTADSAPNSGGDGAGPDPGMFGRGALGACLAMGYATRAACCGVKIESIEVEVRAEYDARGYYGLADVPPGYLDVRYVVTVCSDAPAEVILRLLDEADAQSPYRDVFARAQTLHREVNILKESQS